MSESAGSPGQTLSPGFPDMFEAVARVLFCLLAGETLSQLKLLPVPGPVIGLLLLYCTLLRRRGECGRVRQRGGNSGVAEVAADHAATVEI